MVAQDVKRTTGKHSKTLLITRSIIVELEKNISDFDSVPIGWANFRVAALFPAILQAFKSATKISATCHRLLVRFKHVAGSIVDADHSIM